MLRYLFIFILVAASLLLTASAKGAIIHMIYNVAECNDPKDTNPWEQDKRSITNFPSVTQEDDVIYIYSNIMQNNVNIIIKDSSNNIIQSTSITLFPNQPTAIKIVTTIKGDIFVQSPANAGNFFQIDTNPAATRLASHLDQVVFYNTGTSTFNSIQVKNVYNYSDARAKANIQSLSQGLSILQQLRPVSYNFTDNSDNTKFRKGGDGKEIGLLAQEVEQVLPNIVLTDPDGNKLINYTSLIAVLIDAVKDLNEKVAALEAQQ